MSIQIEKGIPILPGNEGKIHWTEMSIGDSFLVETTMSQYGYIRSNAYHAGARYGMKFTCRKTDGGIRVWRIA